MKHTTHILRLLSILALLSTLGCATKLSTASTPEIVNISRHLTQDQAISIVTDTLKRYDRFYVTHTVTPTGITKDDKGHLTQNVFNSKLVSSTVTYEAKEGIQHIDFSDVEKIEYDTCWEPTSNTARGYIVWLYDDSGKKFLI
jgi:hypothetical protein